MIRGARHKNPGLILASLILSLILAISLLSVRTSAEFPISQPSTRIVPNFVLSPLTCLNATHQENTTSDLQIAMVAPIFTATPYDLYDTGSFYAFYHKYAGDTKPVTTDLDLLNTSLSYGWANGNGWGASSELFYSFLSLAQNCGLVLGRNLSVLTDINVTNGALFSANGSRNYDALIIGFSEYVTAKEYAAYEKFVATGGTMILTDSDSFQVEVGYSAHSNHEWLIGGHGWAFNGQVATPSVQNFFNQTNADWLASSLCCFHDYVYTGATPNRNNPIGRVLSQTFGSLVFKTYRSHEENAIDNFTDTSIIATFRDTSGIVVAAYIHRFGYGRVISSGVFLDDILSSDLSATHFMVQSLVLALDYENAEPPLPWDLT